MPAYLFAIAYLVDWILGDPQWLPHPVRLMGSVIKTGEGFVRKLVSCQIGEFIAGMMLTAAVVSVAFTASHYLLRYATLLNPLADKILLVYLAAATIATRDLIDEARSVYRALQSRDLDEALERVGRIVGRDTGRMDHSEVVRATIETLAESTSDGIVAPMFY